MDQSEISRIIRRRQYGSAVSALISLVFSVYMLISYGVNRFVLVVVGLQFLGFIFAVWLFFVHRRNYPTPGPSYRKINKIVYLYMARIFAVLSILSAIQDLMRFKQTRAMEDLGLAGAETASGILSYRTSKKAEFIEAYYFNKDQQAHVDRQLATGITDDDFVSPVPWILVGVLGAALPTIFIMVVLLAITVVFSVASSTFALYGVLLGFGLIIGPLASLAPYFLFVGGMAWVLSKLLGRWNVPDPNRTALMMLLGAGCVDASVLLWNVGLMAFEVIVIIAGVFIALHALLLSELTYGRTKKWLQNGTMVAYLAITCVSIRLLIASHS